jgi:rSAM/selenodomain-associated transferase 1
VNAPASSGVTVAVIAKAPVAGRVKTRLCPPCTPEEAAAIAAAALDDTVDAARASTASRVVVVLDGEPGPWLSPGTEVVPQRGDGLDERLAAAVSDVGGPLVVVGMDTPQLTPELLDAAAARLVDPGTDAVLGPAEDGGYWCIGLRAADPGVFHGVPMSTAWTGRAQVAALGRRGLTVGLLAVQRDVDRFDDAVAVAAASPDGRFAVAVGAVAARVDGPLSPGAAVAR